MIDLPQIEYYFDNLLKKANSTSHRFIQHEGHDIKFISFHKKEYCQWLYQSIVNGSFKFSILKKKLVLVGNKQRSIFQYPLPDLIIHYCVANYFKNETDHLMIENLYSYRKGKSNIQALKKVDQYIRLYKKKSSQKKSRGLFIIRKDISNFSDSVKNNEHSELIKLINPYMWKLNQIEQEIVINCIRPIYSDSTELGNIARLPHLPMGSPIVGYLTNLYLHQMDQHLQKNDHSLYIRYGDDILYVTDNYQQMKEANSYIEQFCISMGLKFNTKKSSNTYLTSPGRPYAEDLSLTHSNYFEYLGMKIDFNEGIILTNEKYKIFFNQLRELLQNFQKNCKSLDLKIDPQEQFNYLIAEINKLLTLNSEKSMIHLDKIIHNISSHSYLKKIDYNIAYELLKFKFKMSSKKVFRNNGYKNLRNNDKLKSIVKYKNEKFN